MKNHFNGKVYLFGALNRSIQLKTDLGELTLVDVHVTVAASQVPSEKVSMVMKPVL